MLNRLKGQSTDLQEKTDTQQDRVSSDSEKIKKNKGQQKDKAPPIHKEETIAVLLDEDAQSRFFSVAPSYVLLLRGNSLHGSSIEGLFEMHRRKVVLDEGVSKVL